MLCPVAARLRWPRLGMDMAKTTEPSMTPWNPWRNATYYSPKWSGAIAAGLFTAYDQSGVSDVRVLWDDTRNDTGAGGT